MIKETQDEINDRRQRHKVSQERHLEKKTPEQKVTDKLIDMKRKVEQRKLPYNTEMALKLFKTVIQEGPTYICTSCHRLLFRGTVTRFAWDQFKDCQRVIVMQNF